jgi:hypothetical protein
LAKTVDGVEVDRWGIKCVQYEGEHPSTSGKYWQKNEKTLKRF